MFIRCPVCHTLFRIQPKQLKAARGQVRCGSCQAVFDGLEFLINYEELSKEELSALARPEEAAARQWQLPFDEDSAPAHHPATLAGEEAASSVEEQHNDAPATAGEPAVAEIDTAPSLQEEAERVPEKPSDSPPAGVDAPRENEKQIADTPAPAIKWSPRYTLSPQQSGETRPRTIRRLGWAFGSLLLIALLAGQLAWYNRNTLALDPRWRPWLQMACDKAGCKLPPLRDPGAIEMVDRNVRSNPNYLNALLITATLVNEAPFAQPYPEVELAMTNLDQKRIASRRFKPSEYLESGNGKGLIPPGASVRLKLEIADPGEEAVGFEFEFF